MKTLPVITLASIFAAGAAQADVFLGFAHHAGDPIVTVATDAHTTSYTGSSGNPAFNIQALGITDLGLNNKLALVSLNLLGTAPDELYVWGSTTGQTGTETKLRSGFTTNLVPAGWTIEESTYYGTIGPYDTSVLLGSATFTDIGTDVDVALPPSLEPYVITSLIHIVSTGHNLQRALSTVTVSAIPEPATNLMLLGGLLTLVGLYLRPGRRHA